MDYSSLLVPGLLYFGYMSALWLIGLCVRNAGLVDFGWPSGFTALALYFGLAGDGSWQRKALIVGMYCLCGVRFMVGWTVRNIRDGEDRRWEFWRQRWRQGEGRFAIRSVAANLFAFYHTQTLWTLFLGIAPLMLSCRNANPYIHTLEWIAVALWALSFLLENVADAQLDRFRRGANAHGRICRTGLWKYSRHPNYFFEFLIWVAYALFAVTSATSVIDYTVLLSVPLMAYWFLVHFTGIPITEQASLERRGDAYAKYQAETNRFFPWFPKRNNLDPPMFH